MPTLLKPGNTPHDADDNILTYYHFDGKDWFLVIQDNQVASGYEVAIYDIEYKEPVCSKAFDTIEQCIEFSNNLLAIAHNISQEALIEVF
jgi:hypothetical protein